jgi:proteasome lid subunit RPN8/RPN11
MQFNAELGVWVASKEHAQRYELDPAKAADKPGGGECVPGGVLHSVPHTMCIPSKASRQKNNRLD